MHPPVDALEAEGALARLGQRPVARDPGVEHAHVDVRVRRQRRETVVLGARVEVVEQEAHADTAVGGIEQDLSEVCAGEVRVPDVRLHVEALRRVPGALHAHHEGLGTVAQQAKSRLSRVGGLGRPDAFGQGASFGRCDGVRIRRVRQNRKLGAARENDDRCEAVYRNSILF